VTAFGSTSKGEICGIDIGGGDRLFFGQFSSENEKVLDVGG
jgi:hypothetical protein